MKVKRAAASTTSWIGVEGKGKEAKSHFPIFSDTHKKNPPYKSRDQKCLLLLPKTKSSRKRSKKFFLHFFFFLKWTGNLLLRTILSSTSFFFPVRFREFLSQLARQFPEGGYRSIFHVFLFLLFLGKLDVLLHMCELGFARKRNEDKRSFFSRQQNICGCQQSLTQPKVLLPSKLFLSTFVLRSNYLVGHTTQHSPLSPLLILDLSRPKKDGLGGGCWKGKKNMGESNA